MTKDSLKQDQIDQFLQNMEDIPTHILKEVALVKYIADKKSRTVEFGGDAKLYMKAAGAFLTLFETREMYEECAELVNHISELQK